MHHSGLFLCSFSIFLSASYTFSCCILFILHYFHASLFLRYILFMLHIFYVALFPCCTFFVLHFSHVALSLCYALLMMHNFILHFFRVALFSRIVLFSCCTFFVLRCFSAKALECHTFFLWHFVCFALFPCYILINIENERKHNHKNDITFITLKYFTFISIS